MLVDSTVFAVAAAGATQFTLDWVDNAGDGMRRAVTTSLLRIPGRT